MKTRNKIITAIILFSVIVVFNSSIIKADIHVYDDDNQYLGILLETSSGYVQIFIPSVSASMNLRLTENNSCTPPIAFASIYYEYDGCTGTPYVGLAMPEIYEIGGALNGFYKPDYKGRKTFQYRSTLNSGCQCTTSLETNPAPERYPLLEVQVPFTTPIAWPLRFDIQPPQKAVVIPLF